MDTDELAGGCIPVEIFEHHVLPHLRLFRPVIRQVSREWNSIARLWPATLMIFRGGGPSKGQAVSDTVIEQLAQGGFWALLLWVLDAQGGKISVFRRQSLVTCLPAMATINISSDQLAIQAVSFLVTHGSDSPITAKNAKYHRWSTARASNQNGVRAICGPALWDKIERYLWQQRLLSMHSIWRTMR